MQKNQSSLGLIIIIIGIAILLGKIGVFGFIGDLFWPVFVLVPGAILLLLYFMRVLPSGVLIPAGILITYSMMFFYCNIVGWQAMGYLWPGFIFGVSVGLYLFYMFDRHRPHGAFVASLVLAIIAGVFFGITVLFTGGIYVLAVVLIGAGLIMLLRRRNVW